MKLEKDGVMYTYRERKRLLFFGLPWTFTVYSIKDDVLLIDTGFFTTEENDCYMYKIQDITLKRSLFERMFGLGTILCYTGDSTHQTLEIKHVKHCVEIKNYISKMSEEARLRRRTVNTLDITASADFDETDGEL